MIQPPPDGISTEGIEPFQPLTGGCLCGAVKYRISAAPLDAGYCHCRLCQKSSGAPTLAWLTVPIHGFAYTHGNPTRFHSSPHSQREFCGLCGTQLAFRRSRLARTVDITLASLHSPDRVQPEYHIWTQSQRPWLEISDSLPRHEDAGPDQYE
jgi:hypothetical protein